MPTENEILRRYGYETTWSSSAGSGTCFSSSHNANIVEAIRHGLNAGLQRVDIFGPVAMCYAYHPRQDSADLQYNVAMQCKGGVGPYLSPSSSTVWDDVLSDALFDMVVVKGGPNGGGHEQYPCMTLTGLRIPSRAALVELLDTFVSGGVYEASVSLSAYFLLDSTIPTVTKTYAWNAAFGGLRKGMKGKGLGYVEPTAWPRGNPPSYAMLENALRLLCQDHWGVIPAYGSLEELCQLFWMPKQSKQRGLYCCHGPMMNWSLGRKVYNVSTGVISDAPVDDPSIWGWVPFSSPHHWEQDWNTGTVDSKRQRLDYGPGPVPLSRFLTKEYRQRVWAGGVWQDLAFISVSPYGMDTMTVGWVDGSQYALQFVSQPRTGTSIRFREKADACAPEWNSQMHSNLLTVFDWSLFSYNSTGDVTGDGRPEVRMRWHKKGTPFVGQLSSATLKDLRTKSTNYGWILE